MESVIDHSQTPGLAALHIENLRHIRRLHLDLNERLVILTGGNGAGKTTILEAVYLLARGRSFRGRKAGSLTTHGEIYTAIRGLCANPSGYGASIEFRRDRDGAQRWLDSVPWEHQETRLPIAVKLVGENAQSLLEGDPALRRTYLDWNVFHVEHAFGRLRKDFHRVLLQRNAALRTGSGNTSAWDRSFVEFAEAINRSREQFFAAWRIQFTQLCHEFDFLADCDLLFRRGWSEQDSLAAALSQARSAEVSRGYTLVGPSRADCVVTRDGQAVLLSRGQTKTVVVLLQLAADRVHAAHGAEASIWLLDDLEAELDQDVCARLRALLEATGAQRFITRVSAKPLADDESGDGVCMFHVEHGEVRASD